jgi:hypothetical protein
LGHGGLGFIRHAHTGKQHLLQSTDSDRTTLTNNSLSDGPFVAKHQSRGVISISAASTEQMNSEHGATAATAASASRPTPEGVRRPDESDTPGIRRSARLAGRLGTLAESQPLGPQRRSLRLLSSQ